jgi:hypothetical protein
MSVLHITRQQAVLIIGDVLTLFLVTVAGFASHDELMKSGLRLLSTFIPLCAAWFLVSPHLGVFNVPQVHDLKQLWRPFWAMVLAAPLAGWLRAVWLGTQVLPVFVLIIGGISALSLLVWRAVFLAAGGRWRVMNG